SAARDDAPAHRRSQREAQRLGRLGYAPGHPRGPPERRGAAALLDHERAAPEGVRGPAMSKPIYPNESKEYRKAREALLKDEQALVDQVNALAAKRRKLPLGGELKEDYVFQWANDGKVGKRVKFSELFGDKESLMLYSFMYGPNWDNPCPSCTSLMDGFDRSAYQVTRNVAFAGIAKAPAEKINAWAKKRGWSQIALLSGFESPFQRTTSA